MAAPMATQSQAKNRSKTTKKKPSYKNVLVDPFKVSWPVIEENVELEILGKMKSIFSACSFGRQPRAKVHNSSLNKKDRRKGTKERKEELKRKREERCKAERDQERSQPLVIGINNVMRCLEKDQLRLVAVCRNVHHSLLAMTNHLIPLCVSRGCPAICLTDLQTQLTPVLSVSSLLALGIKKQTKEDSNVAAIDELVSYISERCKPLEIPWLESDTTMGSNSQSDAEYKTVAEMSTESLTSHIPSLNNGMENRNVSCKPDFSDLYIKKRVSKDGGMESRDSGKTLANRSSSGFGDLDFIHFGNPSVESSNEDGEVVSYTLLASSKTKEVNPNLPDMCLSAGGDNSGVYSEKFSSIGKRKLSNADVEVGTPASKFMKARIRQKVPNPNKKKKKRKKQKLNS